MTPLQYYIIFAGGWAVINGILHDIFVLRQKRPYDRELIRLLIDGHILIFSGIIYWINVPGLSQLYSPAQDIYVSAPYAFQTAIATAIFLLGYCALIYKMLPSFGTILINLIALVWLILEYFLKWK